MPYVVCGQYLRCTRAINVFGPCVHQDCWPLRTSGLLAACNSTMIYAHRTQPVRLVREMSCCCMPYCTSEPFVTGRGTFFGCFLASMVAPRKWTKRNTAAANVVTGRSLMTCQTNACPKYRPNWRVLIATHCKVWKLQRSTLLG